MWHGPCGSQECQKKSQWPHSTEQQKIQFVDAKHLFAFQNLAVRDFVLFMKSAVYFTVHFGCIFFLCKTRTF